MLRINKILFLVTVVSLSGCKRDDSADLKQTEINGNIMFTIDPLAIKDSIDLKLTDILEDLRVVKLEKTDESLIDYIMRCYVGEKYIICTTVSNGILMFSPEGRFIRHIAKNGRGPGEIMNPNNEIWVDEKNDLLYIRDQMMPDQDLLCFDLEDKNFKNIPLVTNEQIRDLIVMDDSIIYLTIMPMMGEESVIPLICQTTSGRLLWKATMKNRLGATNSTIRILDDQIYFNYIWGGDTLYKLNENKLIPFISIKYTGKLYVNQPYTKGDIFLGISSLTHSLFKGYYYEVKDVISDETRRRSEPVMGEKHFFVFSEKEKKVRAMKRTKDNYFGAEEVPFIRPQNNGIVLLIYTPLDISKIAKGVSENPEISEDIRKRITDLNNSIDESDNPVLLIGTIKR